MDLITIVDKDDNVIGSEDRSEVYRKGLIHRLVRVLLFNDKMELLLQWRSKNEDTFPETWDQSAGGHVDAGEDYEMSVYRELEEELGVKDVTLTYLDKFYTDGTYGDKIIKRFNAVYMAIYSGALTRQESEVEKVKWFSIDELQNMYEKHPEKCTLGLRDAVKIFLDLRKD